MEEIEVLKSEVKDLKKEVARLKAAPPPVATPPPRSQSKIWHQGSNRIAGTIVHYMGLMDAIGATKG